MDYGTENALRGMLTKLHRNLMEEITLERQFKDMLMRASQGMDPAQRYAMAHSLAMYLHDHAVMHNDTGYVPSFDRTLDYICKRLDVADWQRRRDALEDELNDLLDEWPESYLGDTDGL
jgi:hypothetical protein